jgi:hypothetical protein
MTTSFINIIPFEPQSTVSFHWCEASHQALWSWNQQSYPLRYLPQEFNDKARMFLVVQKAWKLKPNALHLAVHRELSKRKKACKWLELCLDGI